MGDRIELHSESAYASDSRLNRKRRRLWTFPPRLYAGAVHLYGILTPSMFPNDNILQHLCQSRLKSFEGVGGLDTLASEPPHFTGVRGISQERYECAREKRSVTVRHEQASHA